MAAVAPVPQITQQSILRYRSGAPINFRLLLVNCLILGGCGYVLYASVIRYEQALLDFDTVARTSAVTATPCGLAVPRTKYVLESLNEIADGAFAETNEDDYVTRVRNALCGTDIVVNALRSGLQAKEILEEGDDADAAEASVKSYVCACESASCNAGSYGDFVRRVTNAYMLSAPAFETFVTASNCMGANNPFPSDAACSSHATVTAQLTAAASNTMTLLSGSTGEAYPPLSQMIYRLLALSVIEFHDRKHNSGGCFANSNADSALAFCTAKLSSSSGPYGAAAGITNASKHDYYTRYADSNACGWSTGDAASTRPALPTRRDRKFAASYATATPVLAICSSMLEFGWLGRKAHFGLPDPVSEAQFYPEHAGSSFSRWLAGITYYGLYDANKGAAETADRHTSYLDLKLYVGYKYASTTAWVLAAVISAGYLFAFAAVPFAKLVWIRVIRRQLTNSRTDMILSRPLGTGGTIALVTTVIVGLWIIFVDGGMSVPYAATTDCADYAKAGGPFVTVDERPPDGLLGLVLVILGVFLLIYMSFCRRPPKKQRIIPLSPFPIWPAFALILIILIAALILLIIAGDDWWVRESTNIDGSDTKTTSDFEEIVGAILWALLLMGLLVGLLAQRHMAANVMLNVPMGKLPTFAYLWAGGGLALAAVAAVLLWPLFDCQIGIEVNEIVCGDGTEVKLRVERFWGCIGWFASVIAILFVLFAAYKVLFGTPRKNDPASQAFNRSKDAELKLLADRRNQRRFGTEPAPGNPFGTAAGVAAATGVTGALAYAYDSDDSDVDSLDLQNETGVFPPAQPQERVSLKLPALGGAPAAPVARGLATIPAAFVVSPDGVPYSC